MKALEETIVKQKNEIAKLQNMEETLNLQREEITALNEIVNEMKLKWDKNRQDTIVVNEKIFFDGYFRSSYESVNVLSIRHQCSFYLDSSRRRVFFKSGVWSVESTSAVKQRQSSHRPDTTFEKYSTSTRIQIKGTLMTIHPVPCLVRFANDFSLGTPFSFTKTSSLRNSETLLKLY
jgi:uncharacterized coiled-coil protein SlyX